MKIIYTQNPLKSIVHLDAHDRELFKLNIRIEELEENMFNAHFHLNPDDQYYDPVKARNALYEDKAKLDDRVTELYECYMGNLAGEHCGDCICVPCACTKCYAENLFGIGTITGLGKHAASKIHSAFGKDNDKTLAQALDSLKNYNSNTEWKEWEKYSDGWIEDNKFAYEWLLKYKADHFPYSGST